MPETFVTAPLTAHRSPISRQQPLWSARQLAVLLGVHHLTLLKKVQDRRGTFEIPEGGFKLGRLWRWRDEDVQTYLLKMSGASMASPTPQEIIPTKTAVRKPGRPRASALLNAGGAA